jgi:hypothetical protein
MITVYGKRFLTSSLAGTVFSETRDLAFGIANESDYSVSENNTRLGFEFYRTPVVLATAEIDTATTQYDVIYKATIPQDVSGIITEIGLFPGTRKSSNNYDSKFLSDFGDPTEWYDSNGSNAPLLSSPYPRIGNSIAEMGFFGFDNSSQTFEYKSNTGILDISGYSANDSLTLAYKTIHANFESVDIRFYTNDSNYFYGTFTPSVGLGDKLTSIPMSSVFNNTVGSPTSSSISKIGLVIKRSSPSLPATIFLDGIRINDEDTFDPYFGLISRSILSFTKPTTGNDSSAVVTVTSSENIYVGQLVSGTNISANTTVTAIDGLSITLSQNPTGNISSLNYIGLKKTEGRSVDIEYKISLDF